MIGTTLLALMSLSRVTGYCSAHEAYSSYMRIFGCVFILKAKSVHPNRRVYDAKV